MDVFGLPLDVFNSGLDFRQTNQPVIYEVFSNVFISDKNLLCSRVVICTAPHCM